MSDAYRTAAALKAKYLCPPRSEAKEAPCPPPPPKRSLRASPRLCITLREEPARGVLPPVLLPEERYPSGSLRGRFVGTLLDLKGKTALLRFADIRDRCRHPSLPANSLLAQFDDLNLFPFCYGWHYLGDNWEFLSNE